MAAVAVSSAKRSLRAELKQRLRAMSAEERLRQSRLLAQKVRDREVRHRSEPPRSRNGQGGSGLAACAGAAPARARRSRARARLSRSREDGSGGAHVLLSGERAAKGSRAKEGEGGGGWMTARQGESGAGAGSSGGLSGGR